MKYILKIPVCTFAVLFTLIAALYTCRAELGDTYAISCNRFGGRGEMDRTNKTISWWINDANPANQGRWLVIEQFKGNQCVMIDYVWNGSNTQSVAEGGIWQSLSRNSLSSQVWREFQDRAVPSNRSFVTNDDKLYGTVWLDPSGYQHIRVAYKTWLERHNLLKPDPGAPTEDNALPQVQDAI